MDQEGELARRAAAGDGAAFAALVRQHQSKLRGFLRRLTRGDAALADDLAQETFLLAHRKLAQYRGEGSFSSWLLGIGWSCFLMERRRRKEETVDTLSEGSDTSLVQEAGPRIDLERAMARLIPEERAALTLCYALGHSHGEAAAILALPLGTLKSHVGRGREKLKAMLEAQS
ncbi:MAG: RNA polymerase sigma factor [Alphaproteobacteria bacterium]|nr:RNA polymerase sigma factor [Alphaproteobacteria bacterium]MBV9692342.1 RNA polymerase sigma factor [Alphaproteobacteria bacterium]